MIIKRIKNISYTYKITLAIGLINVAILSGIFIFYYFSIKNSVTEHIDTSLINSTKIAKDVLQRNYETQIIPLITASEINYDIIRHFYVNTGSSEESKEKAKNSIVNIFKDSIYNTVGIHDSISFYQPHFKTEIFQNQDEFEKHNTDLFDSIIINKNILIENYEWLDNDSLYHRIGYFRYFEPWNIIICSSFDISYFDSLAANDEEFRRPIVALRFGNEKENTYEEEQDKPCPHTGYFYIINDKNVSVMHPFKSYQGKKQPYWHLDSMIRVFNRNPEAIDIISYEWQNPCDSDSLLKEASYIYFDKLNWILSGGYYHSYIYKPVKDITTFILIMSGVFFIIIIVLSVIIGKSIAKPIKELALHAKKFGDGNWDEKIDNASKDEVGILSTEFNMMASKIKNNTQELENRIEEAVSKIKNLARRSAISTILSRNVSHAFGSHVLPGINNDLIITDLEKSYFKFIMLKEAENYFLAKYASIRNVNSHLQSRMEFIADISAAKPVFANTLNFKEILDELFDTKENTEFIKYISNNINVKQSLYTSIQSIKSEDVQIDFPNDLLGVQAFYTILINIIRNAVKHSPVANKSKGLTLYFNVGEEKNENFIDDLLYVDIIEKFEVDEPYTDAFIVDFLNDKFKQHIIDDKTQKIREGGWGLMEMKISAGYLRMISVDDIEQAAPSLIEAHHYDSKTHEICPFDKFANLGFRIYLKKPSLCLVLTHDNFKHDDINKKKLHTWGIQFINTSEFQKQTEKYLHKFVVNCSENDIACNKCQRFLDMDTETYNCFINMLKHDELDNISKYLWEQWQNSLYKESKIPDIKFDNCDSETETQNMIAAFERHGTSIINFTTEDVKNKFIYFEPYRGGSHTHLLARKEKVLRNENQVKHQQLLYEIAEAVKTNIVIIDERIQKAAENKYTDLQQFKIKDVLSFMGIEIPETNLEDYSKEPQKFKEFLEAYIEKKLRDDSTDFIVIHITLFEYLCKNKEREGIEEKLAAFEKIISEKKKSIVLISGRGMPANLPGNCFYMHFSTIQNYLIFNMSKFHLNKVLYSLRRRN